MKEHIKVVSLLLNISLDIKEDGIFKKRIFFINITYCYSGTPSIFDCNLASTYGYTAGALI